MKIQIWIKQMLLFSNVNEVNEMGLSTKSLGVKLKISSTNTDYISCY